MQLPEKANICAIVFPQPPINIIKRLTDLEGVLLSDGEDTEESLPAPAVNICSPRGQRQEQDLPEVVVPDGGVVLLSSRVQNVDLNLN